MMSYIMDVNAKNTNKELGVSTFDKNSKYRCFAIFYHRTLVTQHQAD